MNWPRSRPGEAKAEYNVKVINQGNHPMFLIDFDYNLDACEGFSTVEEAHEYIMREAGLLHDKSIRNVVPNGTGANGWPSLQITFATKIKAARYVAAYLGDDYMSDAVIEFLQSGVQV
jgi:hypothetical protein